MTAIERARPVPWTRQKGLSVRAQLQTALALIQRDLAVLFQNFFGFVVRTATQPALFAFVFAYVFPRIGQGIGGNGRGGGLFANVLLPGLMASTLIFQGIQSVALPLVQEFSFSREIEDRVMAPVPVAVVALCKVISGAIQGVFAAALVIPIVWIATGRAVSINFGNPITLVTMVVLGSLVGASLGLLLGTVVEPRQINLVFALLVLPLTLLGCVYYPWSTLHALRWLQIAVLFNPVVYMSEGLRSSLAPQVNHLSLWAVYALLLGALTAMSFFGVRGFRKRVIT
ncbi:MAG TPA: ABC transporter permease [Dehalococcoidia bacterium]